MLSVSDMAHNTVKVWLSFYTSFGLILVWDGWVMRSTFESQIVLAELGSRNILIIISRKNTFVLRVFEIAWSSLDCFAPCPELTAKVILATSRAPFSRWLRV